MCVREITGMSGGGVCRVEGSSPSSHGETELTHAVQQSRGLLEESRHLGTLVHWTLDRQEAPIQLVNQTHVHHIAGRREKIICSF